MSFNYRGRAVLTTHDHRTIQLVNVELDEEEERDDITGMVLLRSWAGTAEVVVPEWAQLDSIQDAGCTVTLDDGRQGRVLVSGLLFQSSAGKITATLVGIGAPPA